ncbi:hypothetical protein PC118_g6857 [Phytophthora cactorum]|uniref:ZSWIM1/3 RNaseH-like domain-containing protein n=1 Tax=Phytophthora cactorum TaxID=29920 RepID=A0A8T1GD92_9STRA|nr:hypothetical protein PC118_g6857 [Phytophthora cactorum]
MIEFSQELGNIGRIFVDKNIATFIILQTKHMRELFNRFPEVVMIDATHERLSTLLTALEEFKWNNPVWSRIECILVDKDLTEISVLKMAFLGTLVLLCQFHVLKYLREEIASSDYGFNVWQKQQLHGIVKLIVYAKTEREFERYRKYMRHVMAVGRGGLSGLTAVSYLTSDSDQLDGVGSESGAIGSEAGALDFEVGEVGAGGVAEAPTDLPIHILR